MAMKLTMFGIAIPGLPKLRYVENARYSFQITGKKTVNQQYHSVFEKNIQYSVSIIIITTLMTTKKFLKLTFKDDNVFEDKLLLLYNF